MSLAPNAMQLHFARIAYGSDGIISRLPE